MRRTLLLLLMAACPSSSNPGIVDGGSDIRDASPVDVLVACPTEGATEIRSCGNCGERSERCTGGYWVPQSACLGEGECPAGTAETGALPLCGEQQRLCSMECAWGDWVTTVPGTGACEPGSSGTVADGCPGRSFRTAQCNDSCEWVVDVMDCTDGCSNDPLMTPPEWEEICIPAGPFMRGAEGNTEGIYSGPVREVYIDAYYIDRYPATIRRYKECVAAGTCADPAIPTDKYTDPLYLDHILREATWDDAEAYCTWRGRRLITEAEYEKAGRGPAPSEVLYPWSPPVCETVPDVCNWYGSYYSDPYDGRPATASVYGVEQLVGARQWTSDWASATYYADDSSLVNPQGPAVGTEKVSRGKWRGSSGDARLTNRFVPSDTSAFSAVRCARVSTP